MEADASANSDAGPLRRPVECIQQRVARALAGAGYASAMRDQAPQAGKHGLFSPLFFYSSAATEFKSAHGNGEQYWGRSEQPSHERSNATKSVKTVRALRAQCVMMLS
jgi:hypothetical protein